MKRLIYIPILLTLLAGLASCQRDMDLVPDDEVERVDDLPIRLDVSISNTATRVVENAKKEFTAEYIDDENPQNSVKGDVIHIQSTFTLDETEADGTDKTEVRYSAMKLNSDGKWVYVAGKNFAWPNKARSGKFIAYYVHGVTGELSDNNASEGETSATTTLFSDIIDGQDPLRAVTGYGQEGEIRYGHTVKLEFKHMLTHLNIIELDAGIDDKLSFHVYADPNKIPENIGSTPDPDDQEEEGETEVDPTDPTDPTGPTDPTDPTDPGYTRAEPDDPTEEPGQNNEGFNNAFAIVRSGDKIVFMYRSIKTEGETVPVIKSKTVRVRDKQTREESCQVGFFLQPDLPYSAFSIYFSNGDRYLRYKSTDQNADQKFLYANNRYEFNVKKSSGITIDRQPEQKWDESDDLVEIVDAEGFLRAVNTNSEFIQEGVQILEPTTNPAGTLLKCNVKFKEPYYRIFTHPGVTDEDGNQVPEFVPNVGSDNVFDGGYHYIKELCCPLFYENTGVIKNLGLANVTIGSKHDENGKMWRSVLNYQEEGATKAYEYNRTGAIVTNNNGTVENIRVKNLNVTVGIDAADSQEAHNAGALFGVNNSGGFVDKVYLSGEIKVTLMNYNNLIPEVNIGGLAGQNLGTMTNIVQLVDNSLPEKPLPVEISVINELKNYYGAYYIGGLVGNNTGKLSDVSIPTTPTEANGQAVAVTIDSSKSTGVLSDIGGIAGRAGSSQGNEISSCLIGSGVVTAGQTAKYEAIDSYSYTGGIVGVLSERTHVNNCTTFCSVIGLKTSAESVTRATGGAFGNIMPLQQSEGSVLQPGKMTAIAAFGEKLEGDNRGCFVGEAPAGKTWASDYEKCADVKKFDNVDYVGTNSK